MYWPVRDPVPRPDQKILANPLFDSTEIVVVERILAPAIKAPAAWVFRSASWRLHRARVRRYRPGGAAVIPLDVGTDNEDNLQRPALHRLAAGRCACAARNTTYSSRCELSEALSRTLAGMMVQWEDFWLHNATGSLDRYRDRVCSFNDDIQGTAAPATGALLAAINVIGVPSRAALFSAVAVALASPIFDVGDRRRAWLHDAAPLLSSGRQDVCWSMTCPTSRCSRHRSCNRARGALAHWNSAAP